MNNKTFYDLTHPQKRIWYVQNLISDVSLCNIGGLLKISKTVDFDILNKVMNIIMEKNEGFRFRFALENNDVKQYIDEYKEEKIDRFYFKNFTELKKWTDEDFKKQIPLYSNKLYYMALFNLGDEQSYVYLKAHHIIADGWSLNVVSSQFCDIYNKMINNEAIDNNIEYSYTEFIASEQKYIASERFKKDKEYWNEKFTELPDMLIDDAKDDNIEGKRIGFDINIEKSMKIREFCNQFNSSLNTFFIAVLNLYLRKTYSKKNITIGTGILNRSGKRERNGVGMFVSTMPFKYIFPEKQSFKELIADIDNEMRVAFKHQKYPYDILVGDLKLNQKGYESLYEIVFTYLNYSFQSEDKVIGDTLVQLTDKYCGYQYEPLKIIARDLEENGRINLSFDYRTSLFSEEDIQGIYDRFNIIIDKVLENIDTNLDGLECVSDKEKIKLLNEFNKTDTEYPRDKTIQQLFEEQTEKTPNSIAVVYEDKKLTYRELNEKSNSLARLLRENGVGKETIVGIMVDRSLEMIIGVLGILKAGGAYLPIDSEYPEDRIKYMLEDSKTKILLTQNKLLKNINYDVQVINLEDDKLYEKESSNLNNVNKADNLAYVIYTSGTTGKPKGVLIEHRSVVRLVKNTNYINLCEEDRILQTGSIVFDASTFEIWGAILNGAQLYLVNKDVILSSEMLEEALHRYRITVIWLTSALFTQLSQYNPRIFNGLKYLLAGGDVLSPKHINLVRNMNKNITVINGYGPTENTTFSTTFLINKNYENNIPIGKPISNSKAYILGENDCLVPIGVAGELCVAGDGLARGYLNREELTREKFIDNPFDPGTKMYRTGDLTRWLPDGNIEYLGRIDNQVKIRDFRIEIGEIENQLSKLKEIKEAVVLAKSDDKGDKYLCGYVTSEGEISVTEIKDELSEKLPSYMIPSYIVKMDKLPLTTNGKVDKRALPEIDITQIMEDEYEAPRNKIEEKIVEIWEEILGIEGIGINHNYFDLGGHSLKAAVIVAKINKELEVGIKVKELFENPTIKGLGRVVERAEKKEYIVISKAEEKNFYRASSAEKRMFTLWEMDKANTVYNVPMILEIEEELDEEKVEIVLNELIKRHEALRTSFHVIDGEILQTIHKRWKLDYGYEEVEENLVKEKIDDFIKPFDLTKAPLVRSKLIKCKDKKYIFILDLHHIVADGVSMSILMKEFVELYKGHSLREPQLQYRDYSEWQNSLETNGTIERQEQYWLDRLSGEIPVLNIVTDYERPNVQSYEGDRVNFVIDNKLKEKLNNAAKETGTTLYMLLLAAYNVMLAKYSGQEDIIVGTAQAGRSQAELEDTVGMFVNTVALRNQPNGNKTFREFLAELKDNTLKDFENLDYQFDDLVNKLDVKRDVSRNPVFDVMFVLENMDFGIDENYMKIKLIESELNISKFDLTLVGAETEDGINFNLEYCSKLFKKETIERMKEHYTNILDCVVSKLDSKICEIDVIGAEEKDKLLNEFNKTEIKYPKDKTIQQLFEEQAEKSPDNIAIEYEDKKLTYGELNERANSLARVLREKGIKADTVVGIMVDRSLEMMIGIMGILKSGGAYLPIDPEYPEDRIKYMLEDSKAKIILRKKNVGEDIDYSGETIYLEDKNLYVKEKNNLTLINKSNNLAYIIYTSGSTGTPKGVLIEHYSVMKLVKNPNYIDVTCNDTLLQLSNYAFDGSIFDIYGSLLNGAKLVMLNKNDLLEINKLGSIITNKKISVFFVTTALFNSIVDNNIECLKNIRKVLFGGESISVRHAKKALEYLGENHIVHVYGPTEGTVYSTYYNINHIDNAKGCNNIPIGSPLSNSKAYILGKDNCLVPIGVAGELCVAGDGLARGYLNREELTREKFADNPFEPGAKMYRTGDLARWLPDGNIEYLGRIDNQVKIRGFRIEIGEIENKLSKLKEIKEAVVVAKISENGDKYLCAYITAEQEVSASEIKEELSKELPAYMIPSYIVQIDKFPLTLNGKVDKRALPEIDITKIMEDEYEAPRNEIEEKLIAIWEEVLAIEGIGINHNYFDLGGHSLKASVIAAKIKKEFEVEIKVREIFENPTIKALSRIIEKAEKQEYIIIGKAEEKEFYKASSAEKRIFALWEMDKFNTVYNVPMILEMKEKMDSEKVKIVLNELVKRHEALRTSFEVVSGEIVQKIHKKWELEFEYEEVSEKEVKEKISNFIKPFDLTKAPLIRSKLVKCTDEKYIFMLDVHHIVTDGISMSILIKEFTEVYRGKELRKPLVQYKDYSEWQNSLEENGVLKRQEEYWLNRLKGETPILNMVTDYERPNVQSYEGDRINFAINNKLKEKLNNIAKETGTTLYMVLLASYNVMLARYSGQEDIIVGTAQAGRSQAELEDTVGMFVNTVALRNYPNANRTFRDFLKEVKDNTLKDFENLDYQFDDLVNKLDVKRDMSRNPLFDVMFVLENMDFGLDQNNMNIKLIEAESELTIAKFDLTLTGAEIDEGISFSLEYCTKLFKKETVERMKEHYINILKYVTTKLDSKIYEIDLIGAEERDKLLNQFNRTKAEYPQNVTIVDLFEKQVQKTPDNIAVVYKDKKLTYRELNEKSNTLARLLREKGVEAETIVGIMMDKSLEMIIGIMGILKAGGAYLPIDFEYPEDRIKYMLEDSSTKILLTQNKLLGSVSYAGETIDLEDNNLYERENSNLYNIGKSNDLAYVIYTSGTTGKPKGVMIEQKALVNLCFWHNEYYEVTEKDRATKYAGFGFDASVWEIFPYIITGATLYMIDKSIMLDKDALNKYYEDNQITIGFLPTQMCEEFMNLKNKSLRKLLTGADKLKVYKKQTYELINNYGPTENAVVTTSFVVDKDYRNIPIGKPISNSRIYILGDNNALMPVGTCGELCVSGDGLARGYLNREELTREKFVDNPFEPGVKMYRTGDLARWLPDGNIEYLGRIDNQVKVRGFRIEIGEIENQLLKIKEIKEAVVIAKSNENGDKYLCGYVTAEQEVEVASIKEELSKELPSYMIPSYILQIDSFPLTPNGKIDKRALPEIDVAKMLESEYESPRNEIEEKLVKVWEEVLDRNHIGINDNYFDLGGHSLKAALIMAKIKKEFEVQIEVRKLFENPTVKTLARIIEKADKKEYVTISKAEEKEFYKASSAEKRIFTLWEMDKLNTVYNIPMILEIQEKMDNRKVEIILNKLIERHEALRTSFKVMDGEIVQKIHNEWKLDYEYEEVNEKMIKEKVDDFTKPFDLTRAPLMRSKLIKCEDKKYIFMLDVHHIVSDGVSMSVLMKEFMKLYNDEKLEQPILQYRDYSEWQNSLEENGVIEKQEEYWLNRLNGELPILKFETDYERPKVQSYEGNRLNFAMDKELKEKLNNIAKDTGTTLYMVLLAAYNVMLSKYSGQEDIIVGTAQAGRSQAELEDTVGMFVNTVALRNYPNGNKTFREFLNELKNNTLRDFENLDYQFDDLVNKLSLKRDVSRNPVFDVMFVLENMDFGLDKNEMKIKMVESESTISKFDFTLTGIETKKGMDFSLTYCSKLFKAETMEKMKNHYINLIKEAANNIDIKLCEIKMLSAEELKEYEEYIDDEKVQVDDFDFLTI